MFKNKHAVFIVTILVSFCFLLALCYHLPVLAAPGDQERAANIQLGEEVRQVKLLVWDDEPPLINLRALANACSLSLDWDAKTNLAIIGIGDLAVVYHPLLKSFYCLERSYPQAEAVPEPEKPLPPGIPISSNLLIENSDWQTALVTKTVAMEPPTIGFSKVIWPEPPLVKNGTTYISLPFLSWLGMTAFWDEDFRCLDLLLVSNIYQNPGKAMTLEEVLPLIKEDFDQELAAAKAAQPKPLASYSTKFNPNEKGRTINLKLAAAAINGTEIKPGSIFSFNNVVGPRTSASGYQKAIVFVGGKKELDYGGGVCQVSSTLYNTVLEAKLKVIERHPHGQPVTYVPKGRDATVSFGQLDFRFRNDTPDKLKIVTSVENNVLRVELWKIK